MNLFHYQVLKSAKNSLDVKKRFALVEKRVVTCITVPVSLVWISVFDKQTTTYTYPGKIFIDLASALEDD